MFFFCAKTGSPSAARCNKVLKKIEERKQRRRINFITKTKKKSILKRELY
jgi:hypothetical protein